ncbi:MAG: NRDE family protein [Planctomycetaceae bacterium]|nr:NRDE family protein [Planctomycetaceae bacterium]
MCTLAILYRVARGTPILVAANRDERFDRPTQYPKIQSGTPRVVCGIDRQAGGTWLGVNQYGLFCAVGNRPKRGAPLEPRSRGLLCRELLELKTAKDAAAHAAKELSTGAYAGANYICADGRYAAVVHGGDCVEVVELSPGLHVVTNGNVDDFRDERHEFVRRMLTLHTLDSAVTFLAVASRVFSRRPNDDGRRGVVFSDGEYGTVSSTLLALPRKIQQAVFQYASGTPCDCAYDDLSALLRQVLSTDRSRKNQEGNGEAAKSREKTKAVAGKSKELVKKGKGH